MHTIQVYKYKLNSKQGLRLVINFRKISCWIGSMVTYITPMKMEASEKGLDNNL